MEIFLALHPLPGSGGTPASPGLPSSALPPKVDHQQWHMNRIMFSASRFLDKQSLFPNTAVGSSENWLVCGHTKVSRAGWRTTPAAGHSTPRKCPNHCGCGPFCSCKNPVYKTLWQLHKREQQGEMARDQTHLVPAPWGRQVRVSPASTNKINQANLSLLSCWCEKQVALPVVKTPCFEATLPECVTPFCYFLVVWSQKSYLTSLNLNHCNHKIEIMTVISS